jgi:hypothetical protein
MHGGVFQKIERRGRDWIVVANPHAGNLFRRHNGSRTSVTGCGVIVVKTSL